MPPERREVTTLVENEQIKARAALLNSGASSCFVAGGVTPLALALFGSVPPRVSVLHWIGAVIIFLTIAAVLHRLAIRTLRGLVE